MCGIAGWIDWDADLTQQRPALAAMCDRLACRGPDAEGAWITPHAAFVHRRLSVIDPEGGRQPMIRSRRVLPAPALPFSLASRTPDRAPLPAADAEPPAEEPFVLTYNGELYNTAELRAELESRGHTFTTRCDTEVLLRGYIEWGPACVERFNGIFAFGVWDQGARTLFLARDRLGVKPLFYACRARGLVFASELKSLLVHPDIPAAIDAEGLGEVFALGPARTPGVGVFRGVQELRPGSTLTFDVARGVRVRAYWRLHSAPHTDDLETTAATVRDLLCDTVVRQLVSDVPIATLLSGGLDSSAVTAIAARHLAQTGRGPLRTYSLEFAGTDRDFAPTAYYTDPDAPWAARMVEAFTTDHRVVTLDTPEQAEALTRAVTARDLPGLADVDSSLYLFCREIRRETTVGLSGEAADEVFGGYPWCHWEEAITANTFPWARATALRAAVLSPEVRARVRSEEYIADRYRQALAEVPRLAGESPREARMREILYLNITRFLPTLLDRKDRMSMAVGLEVRVPFCDHRLVAYVWNIPWSMKTCDGQAKGILRRALRGVLPEDVLGRKKVPYPRTFNPTYLAAVRGWLRGILADPSSPLRELVDRRFLGSYLEQDGPPDVQWFGQTMSGAQFYAYLCQVDAWMRAYRVHVV